MRSWFALLVLWFSASVATQAGEFIKLDAQALKDYVGVYYWAPHKTRIRVTLEGEKLFGKPDTKDKAQLQPIDMDVFIIGGVGAELHFVRNAEYKVTSVLLVEDGETQEAVLLPAEDPYAAATVKESQAGHDHERVAEEKHRH